MTSHKPIKKAVFPVAGMGTRFLPATKAIPKELLPIVDRPLIQYAVDEAREAGIEQMIFVTGRGKTAIVEHFDMAYELETTMTERGKSLAVLEPTRATPGDIITVRQQVPMGLGHAIWCARAIVGEEPFAIFLPDELMVASKGGTGCMKQMVDAYGEVGGNLISVLEVPHEEVSSYGVIAPGRQLSEALTEVTGLVEKPAVADAPSNKIISGRYILQPEVMGVLKDQEKGAGGEIQLTDAMARMIGTQPFHAVTFAGRRFDCGSKTGFVEATLALALEREDMGADVRAMAERLLQGLNADAQARFWIVRAMVKRLLALPITGQILRFGLSTGFSAAMSFGVPVLLHEYADMPQRLAVAIGFFAAYVGNIVLLRLFVFRSKGSWRAQVLRYIPTNGVFRLCEYFAFLGLFEKLGLDYRVALLLVLGTSSVIKFFAYRLIFTDRAGPQFAAPDLEPANPLQR